MTAALSTRRLAVWSLPVALLLLLFAGRVAVARHDNAVGRTAYAQTDYVAAQQAFESSGRSVVPQSWLAPFNEGDARFGRHDTSGAISAFGRSLASVPQSQECTVRINLATVHEAVGDTASTAGDPVAAGQAYRLGRSVLAAGRCPQEAGQGTDQQAQAQALDDELADRLGQTDGSAPTPTPTPSEAPTAGDRQQDQLRQNNEEGEASRRDNRDFNESPSDDGAGGARW